MKIKVFSVFVLFLCLTSLLPVWGQKILSRSSKALVEKSGSFMRRGVETGVKTGLVAAQQSSTAVLPGAFNYELFKEMVVEAKVNNDLVRLQELAQFLEMEAKKAKDLLALQNGRLSLLRMMTPLRGTSFQAVNGLAQDAIFSGTVFQTLYNGKVEVFGVIPAHAIAYSAEDPKTLRQEFKAIISMNGKQQEVPVEIVQLSSPLFLDLALVKFPKDILNFLSPLPLSQNPVKPSEVLHSPALEELGLPYVGGRVVQMISPMSLRTSITVAKEERAGMCGTPVLNDQQQIVGIHTGSTKGSEDFYGLGDVSYVATVDVLNSLVSAYFNGGMAKVPFVINGEKVADMNIDEHLVSFSLLDDKGNTLWNQEIKGRFSSLTFNKILSQNPQTRFLMLRTKRVFWDETGSFITEEQGENLLGENRYFYDFKKHVPLNLNFFTKREVAL